MGDTTEEIWKTYHSVLHGFIKSRVRDPSVADDILQDVFVKIHSGIDSLKDSTRIKGWIYQIARNAVIDHYRAHRESEQLPDDLAAPEADGSERVRGEVENCVTQMVQTLPDSYREALTLSEIQGLAQKGVAEQLGISVSGAKSRVQRGRAMLKDMLLRCCHFEFDRRGGLVDYERKSPCCDQG